MRVPAQMRDEHEERGTEDLKQAPGYSSEPSEGLKLRTVTSWCQLKSVAATTAPPKHPKFLNKAQKALTTKEETDKLNYSKIKTSAHQHMLLKQWRGNQKNI